MGKRVVTVSVVWSGLGWGAYSPRSRLGLPVGRRRVQEARSASDGYGAIASDLKQQGASPCRGSA